ncbi:hypothetical protein COP2_009173 [Malus domestica]
MVGAVVGLGALLYLSAQSPNHEKRKELGDDDSKKREPPKKHLFVNPKIKDLRLAPFPAPGFRPANYLAIEDGKVQESVDAAALKKKKGEGPLPYDFLTWNQKMRTKGIQKIRTTTMRKTKIEAARNTELGCSFCWSGNTKFT